MNTRIKKDHEANTLAFIDIKNLEKDWICLGEGTFANVYYSEQQYPGVAIKVFKDTSLKWEESEKNIIQKLMNHPIKNTNILDYYPSDIGIAMEYATHGSLLDLLNRSCEDQAQFTSHSLDKLAYDLSNGLLFLHDILRIVHADLKLENILVFKHSNSWTFKLTDFGLSEILEKDQNWVEKRCGSLEYVAPEIFKKNRISFASDMFAFAVILFAALTLQLPFTSEHKDSQAAAEEIYNKILEFRPFIPICSEAYGKIISKGWIVEYEKRPSAAMAFNWMKESPSIKNIGLFETKIEKVKVKSDEKKNDIPDITQFKDRRKTRFSF